MEGKNWANVTQSVLEQFLIFLQTKTIGHFHIFTSSGLLEILQQIIKFYCLIACKYFSYPLLGICSNTAKIWI